MTLNHMGYCMKTAHVFSCGECGESFTDEHVAHKHEEECQHLEVGDTVRFEWSLLPYQGRITMITKPDKLGDRSIIHIVADEEIYEPDPSQCRDGKSVFVTRDCIIENLSRKK